MAFLSFASSPSEIGAGAGALNPAASRSASAATGLPEHARPRMVEAMIEHVPLPEQPPFLSGRLLLAMPGMADPRFERAVIALCAHDENGAIGIGIGHKRAGIGFRGLLRQLDIDPGEAPDLAVHHGGPVEPGRGFILHSTDWGGQDTLQVNGAHGALFAMTGTIDVLKAIAAGKGPTQWIAALGYAGWGEGQLDEELTRHGWFAADGSAKILFETPTDERWAAAFKAQGIDPRLLVGETGAA